MLGYLLFFLVTFSHILKSVSGVTAKRVLIVLAYVLV